MQTKQIYYADQYQKSLSTRVLSITGDGTNVSVILAETIFYPEGGGQPSDQGLIIGKSGKIEVQQVLLKDGEIRHYGRLTGTMDEGESVETSIDWERRYKNMRVHTAGHIVNDAAMQLFSEITPVEGEHGRKPYIKYRGQLDAISANLILEKANNIIADDVAVKTEFVSLQELKKRATWVPENLPKNKPLRIMQIEGFSVIPDGGTQLARTGEVGKVTEIEIKNEGGYAFINYKVVSLQDTSKSPENFNENQSGEPYVSAGEIINLKNTAIAQINEATSAEELENIRIDYLGRKGKLNDLINKLKSLGNEERRNFGITLNEAKKTIDEQINSQKDSFKISVRDWFDPTYPAKIIKTGHLHPTSIVINEMCDIFKNLGFSVMEGPEIESDHYNFELLNLPKDHPARSLQDVLYIDEPEVLLRSHTSSVETRSIEKLKPPFRIVVAGKCYRYENVNASNNAMFYQFQGVALQEGLSMADLKGTLYHFVKSYFGENRKIRYRCKYYPEVEPGVGLDIDCQFCGGKGCSVCKGRGWIEMLGAGMIHPKILSNFKYNTKEISGFAFGMGLDRIVMDRFGINDIRSLYNGDIKYSS